MEIAVIAGLMLLALYTFTDTIATLKMTVFKPEGSTKDHMEGRWIFKSILVGTPIGMTYLAYQYTMYETAHRRGPWHIKEYSDLLTYEAVEDVLASFTTFLGFGVELLAIAAWTIPHVAAYAWENERTSVLLYGGGFLALFVGFVLILEVQAWYIKTLRPRLISRGSRKVAKETLSDRKEELSDDTLAQAALAITEQEIKAARRQHKFGSYLTWKWHIGMFMRKASWALDRFFFNGMGFDFFLFLLWVKYFFSAMLAGPLIVLVVAPIAAIIGMWIAVVFSVLLGLLMFGFLLSGAQRSGIAIGFRMPRM